jgi:putative ABC transport system permease protein
VVIGRAVETAVRNPVRSILTMLGLAIGVGAFLTMVSWGTGARASIMEQFEIQGTRVVYIWTNVNRRDFGGGAKPLSDADVEALLRDSTIIERVAPRVTEKYHVKSELTTYRTSVTGPTPDFVRIREWPILTGGMFGDTDVQSRAKVAVVGSTVARKLFWGHDPVGRVITIGSSLPCRVVGVLESKGEQVTGEGMDDIVLIPATTYRACLGTPIGYHELMLQVRDIDLLETAMLEAVPIMRRSHLAEAVVLSLSGSLLGVGAGWFASSVIAKAMAWQGSVSPLAVAGAAAFGTGVGVAFGYLPARRAAKLAPTVALGYG